MKLLYGFVIFCNNALSGHTLNSNTSFKYLINYDNNVQRTKTLISGTILRKKCHYRRQCDDRNQTIMRSARRVRIILRIEDMRI